MSWRFLTASVLVTAFFGLSACLRADDGPPPAKSGDSGKSTSTDKSARTGQKAGTDKSAGGDKQAAESKAAPKTQKSAASKTRSTKTSSRLKSRIPSSTTANSTGTHIERATFGAGCFWHVEDTFERLPGVLAAVSGYAGGNVPNPSYEMVHEGFTGHAEVVMVEYDADLISYEDLLKVFWSTHDPTTPNRQGPDIGPQYRSIILYHNEAQRKAALKSYEDLVARRAFRYPIVTQLVPLTRFWRAEDYHQDYYGGKPRATVRRRRTTTAKSRSAVSKKAGAAKEDTSAGKAAAQPSTAAEDKTVNPQP